MEEIGAGAGNRLQRRDRPLPPAVHALRAAGFLDAAAVVDRVHPQRAAAVLVDRVDLSRAVGEQILELGIGCEAPCRRIEAVDAMAGGEAHLSVDRDDALLPRRQSGAGTEVLHLHGARVARALPVIRQAQAIESLGIQREPKMARGVLVEAERLSRRPGNQSFVAPATAGPTQCAEAVLI